MRVFISVELPGNVIEELARIQNRIGELGLIKGKMIERANIHLTLKFLGEIDERKLGVVKQNLAKIKFDKFEVSLGKVGVFNERMVRIIWVDVLGEEIYELQKDVDACLEGIFDSEERFMGHITIARPKFVKDKDKLLKYLKEIDFSRIKFDVDKIYLKESILSGKGPKYKTLMEISSGKKI